LFRSISFFEFLIVARTNDGW